MIAPEALKKNLNSSFILQLDSDEQCQMELIEVTRLAHKRNADSPDPYSCIFRYSTDYQLPQGTYNLNHRKLGTFELFLVPQAPDEQHNHMEAVFN